MAEEPQNPQNQERQQQSRSEASNDLGKTLNQQRELNQAGADFVTILKEIAEAQKQAANAAAQAAVNSSRANIYATAQAAQQKYIADQTKNSVSLASQLSKFSREDLKSKSKRRAFESTYTKALDSQKLLIKEAKKIREEAAYIPGDLKELELDKARALEAQVESSIELFKQAEKLKRTYSLIGRLQKPFEGIEKLVGSIPILKDVLSEFTKASQKIAETYVETGNSIKAFGSGAKQFALGGLQALLGAIIAGILQGFNLLSDNFAALQTKLALTRDQAQKLQSTLLKYRGAKILLEEMESAAIGFGTALGSSSIAAGSTLKRVALLAERLGISAEESAKIYSNSNDALMSFERQTDIIAGTVDLLNQQTGAGIRLTDVFRDISNASADTALSLGKFPNGLAKAAFETRRLGLNLSQIKGVQESLLDFTSSITAEMNAEALLGREFNLDRARYFAFTNDIVNLSKELYELTGGIAGFQKMSFIDQKAMAGLFGMSTEQYADMLRKREALLKIAEDEKLVGFDMLTQEQQIQALVKKYTGKDFNLSVEDARIKALEALQLTEQAQGAKLFKQQESAIGATTDLKIALQNFGISLAQLVIQMTGIQNPIEYLVMGINKVNGYLQKLLLRLGVDQKDTTYGGGKTNEQYIKELREKAKTQGFKSITPVEKEALILADELESGFKDVNVLGRTVRRKMSQFDIFKKKQELNMLANAFDMNKFEADVKKYTEQVEKYSLSEDKFKELKNLASTKITNETTDAEKQKIAGAKKELELQNAIRGLDETKIRNIILSSLKDVSGITVSDEEVNEVLGFRAKKAKILTSLEEYSKKDTDIPANDNKDTNIPANDFTIRTHPKDTLKIAGGTKFGDETNQLLEKLIDTVNNSETNKLLQVLVDTVKQGGNVYLDRRKVGESLVLGYSSQ